MSFTVHDGKFDLVIVAGPRVEPWPSAGVRALSTLSAEMGLTVGVIGGDTIVGRGVLPLPDTGGLVFAEDAQNRIHRFRARAVVRLVPQSYLPDPFEGWRSQGLVPLPTALRLREEGAVDWSQTVVILGTGNKALRFGSSILEAGAREVVCVESYAQWGAKRIAGWEVERRRFEALGGKIIEANPIRLTQKSPGLWEFRVEDVRGVRVYETSRVVSAGPFRDLPGVREYPPGSYLFELEQTAAQRPAEDIEGWTLEEERGRALAVKIIKALITELGPRREKLEKISRRTRARLRRHERHRELPFTPAYQGKWIAAADLKEIKAFSGVPKNELKQRQVASIECLEDISCDLCERACPEQAIDLNRKHDQILKEVDCTGCGKCVSACPSGSILLLQEKEGQSHCKITLPWRGEIPWKQGELATLVNRRGETLGSGRIAQIQNEAETDSPIQLVQVDVPTHLTFEARGLRRVKPQQKGGEEFAALIEESGKREKEKVEITLNGEKRLVRDRVSLTTALYEVGQNRPEDSLYCPDGGCGLCSVSVDGVKKLACQSTVHRRMAIRLESRENRSREHSAAASIPSSPRPEAAGEAMLCPCVGVSRDQVVERLRQGKIQSPEALLAVTHVGEGKCHGQLCMGAFRRLLSEEGLDVTQWIDWRFPQAEWSLTPVSRD